MYFVEAIVFCFQMWDIFVTLVALGSIVVLCLQSYSWYREPAKAAWKAAANATEGQLMHFITNALPDAGYFWVEVSTICLLSGEFLARLIFSPSKRKFCFNLYNFADFLGVVPIWILFILTYLEQTLGTLQVMMSLYSILISLRLFRVFRLLGMAKHYPPMKIFLMTIAASYRELILLGLMLSCCRVISATLIFYAEAENGVFKSIPDGMYWAVITMTSVGYGDYSPKTGLGFVVASICALLGTIILSLIIPAISNNFFIYYNSVQASCRLHNRYGKTKTASVIPVNHSFNENANNDTRRYYS